jgi:thiamine-phosphate diphosphorylase
MLLCPPSFLSSAKTIPDPSEMLMGMIRFLRLPILLLSGFASLCGTLASVRKTIFLSTIRLPDGSTKEGGGDDAAFNDDRRVVSVFPHSQPPFLALITEGNSCDDDEALQVSLEALHNAVKTGQVDLVSVRVDKGNADDQAVREQRVTSVVEQLLSWSDEYSSFRVVVSSEWVDAALRAGAHGIHFKESHRHLIPSLQMQFQLIGISAHSVESAVQAWEVYRPDYLFVGTCFATLSHPEKRVDQLEGPELPGKARQTLEAMTRKRRDRRPAVLAIGGIDASNCHEPVKAGADGAAVIRAVLQAPDPTSAVRDIQANIRRSHEQTMRS